MKKFITSIFTGVALLFAACDEAPKFTIKGSISEADGKSIYLSHVGIDKSTLIDSAKIKSDGKFEFRSTQPQSYDFYRLQLEKKGRAITVAVDSTECCHSLLQGISLTQGSNPRLLHWHVDSLPRSHQGSPIYAVLSSYTLCDIRRRTHDLHP